MNREKNILFLCTGNSARSILAECLMNRLGEGRYHAYSAGSSPTGTIHPIAKTLLESRRFDTSKLRSKSWDEFSAPGAPKMDLVVTVCDSAHDEVCPVWPGAPLQTHWGLEDPAKFDGSTTMQMAHFESAYDILRRRILDFLTHERMPTNRAVLNSIGQIG